jgi:hypothetical protein
MPRRGIARRAEVRTSLSQGGRDGNHRSITLVRLVEWLSVETGGSSARGSPQRYLCPAEGCAGESGLRREVTACFLDVCGRRCTVRPVGGRPKLLRPV